MAKPQTRGREIRVKVADRQLEFLEIRAKELGLSKAALVRWYIVNDMVKAIGIEREPEDKRERISLEGIVSDGRVTETDIEEVEKEWETPELQ